MSNTLRPPHPTYPQSLLASFLLVILSLLCAPFTVSVTALALLWTHFNGTSIACVNPNNVADRKTVLVTGARSNKALTLIRAFKRAGHRVVVAEENEWGLLACARFSRAVDQYYLLPNAPQDESGGGRSAYVEAIKAIVHQEEVDAWVPCSSVHATMQDSEAARQIHDEKLGGKAGGYCDTFIQHPDIADPLHWKDRFSTLLTDLGYPTPESKTVTTIAQALDFLYTPDRTASSHQYILKCLTLDDLARDDFTLLPLASRDETRTHLKKMPTSISKNIPFLLQRFLRGPEYCCHVAARKGKVTAFVVCRSNEMLMRYVDVRSLGIEERKRGNMMEQWVIEFLGKWKAKLDAEGEESYERELTGHFSFDFIWEESEQTLYALECNVRAHTAICLFSTKTSALAESYLNTTNPPLSRPPPQTPAVSWIAHALPLSTFRFCLRFPLFRFISARLWGVIHPGLITLASKHSDDPSDPTASPKWSDTPFSVLAKFFIGTFLPENMLHIYRGTMAHRKHSHLTENLVRGTDKGFGRGERDPYWDWTDPMPFFVLMHVTWAWLFVRLVVARGGKWRRVNVSTERIFEC